MIRRLVIPLAAGVALSLPHDVHEGPRAPAIDVAVEDAAALWSRRDGTGLANDVVRTAFRAAGVDITLRVVPYARCKQMAIQGDVVGCFSMSRDPGLKGVVVFPAMPIFVCYADLIRDPARPLAGTSLRNLPRGTVVGTVLGYEYPDAVREAVKSGAIVLDEAPSEDMLLRKLAAGRLPAALVNVNDSKSLAYLTALAHIPATAMRVERVGTLQSYIGFSVRHPRGAWALAKYEEGMRRISANGALNGIARQWAESSSAAVRAARQDKAPPPQ
jgi:polar amino acid transport system substrate-binding protein